MRGRSATVSARRTSPQRCYYSRCVKEYFGKALKGAARVVSSMNIKTALIVYVSDAMRAALSDLYFQTPKWVISAGSEMLQ